MAVRSVLVCLSEVLHLSCSSLVCLSVTLPLSHSSCVRFRCSRVITRFSAFAELLSVRGPAHLQQLGDPDDETDPTAMSKMKRRPINWPVGRDGL